VQNTLVSYKKNISFFVLFKLVNSLFDIGQMLYLSSKSKKMY